MKIGNRVKIQAFTFIPTGVTIEDDVFIGPRVTFTNDAKMDIKGRECWKETLIKKGVKIGAGALIRAGVTIGERATIGMGAVILKNVSPNARAYGIPAKEM